MRMWMVDPKIMCREHLLGEHRELHMLAGTIRKKKQLLGYLKRNILEPSGIERRHSELIEEMKRRGYKHKTPISVGDITYLNKGMTKVIIDESYRELYKRCKRCALNMLNLNILKYI